MVNGRCLYNPSHRSGKSLIFELFSQVMSLVNGKAGTVSMIMVVCLALDIIMKDQVDQFNKKIGVEAMQKVLTKVY